VTFDLTDKRRLLAAEGWLELGLPVDAHGELEKITPALRDHPDVLEVRWHIYAAEKKWAACVEVATAVIKLAPDRSDGWIHRSFALHEMKKTQAAFDLLLPVADKFPDVWTIPYNLACYASRLHQFDEAQKWLKQAVVVDEETVREAATEDKDLKPLWDSLGGTMWKRE
jgi:tetratricopeptide (TPR) repeat protein